MRRKAGIKENDINDVLSNVLKTSEHEGHKSRELAANDLHTLGRKQRRRNLKKQRKLNKLNYTTKKSDAMSKLVKQSTKFDKTKIMKVKKLRKNYSGSNQNQSIKKVKVLKSKDKSLLEDIKREEREISDLEKLMFIKKKKAKLPSSFAEDGLDYILNVVDMEETEDTATDDSEAESTMSTSKEDLIESENSSSSDVAEVEPRTVDKEKDIKSDDCSSNYIPPAKRLAQSNNEVEKQKHLKRHLKGLLNRISDSNMHSVCGEVMSVFDRNSRALATESLTDIVLDQCFTIDPVPEKLITESAMLISAVGNNHGLSVTSHFVETVAKKINTLLQMENYGQGKEYNNLLQLLCSLYQLQAIQSKLLLDQMDIFMKTFKEKDVELLVMTLKSVGFQIRKEDPVALKGAIEKITLKAQDTVTEESSRMKYMIDILTAIKNNNVRKLTGYDADIVSQRRKKVKAMCKADGDSFPNVSFSDLVHADERGRWWIVGSSWAGTPMLQETKVSEENNADDGVSSQMMQVAKKLRMNTDVRRKIFYAAVSSEDFVEAFGKIQSLNLKGKQLREIGHVLVECCQQQRTFNPFFFHLLQKFCLHDRQFVLSVQCSLWDKFKLLDSMSSRQVQNIVSLLSHLSVSEAIPLSCLKAVEFSKMDKSMVSFLRNVLINIAEISKTREQLQSPFAKLAATKLKSVTQGLQLFIQYFMLNDSTFISEHSKFREELTLMDAAMCRTIE